MIVQRYKKALQQPVRLLQIKPENKLLPGDAIANTYLQGYYIEWEISGYKG